MSDIKLLDVTLRDGGYKNKFHFSKNVIHATLQALNAAGVDYVEVGYRNGSLKPISNIGVSGLCHSRYLEDCKALLSQAKMTVMVHPHNVSKADLLELGQCGVDLLRVCVGNGNILEAVGCISLAKEIGIEVSANITRSSQYSIGQLNQVILELCNHGADIVYLADSNGSMLPKTIATYYQKFAGSFDCQFGFHAHDNLGLAQSNAIAALTSGASYIDVSLWGVGKGIGNLKAEHFIAYLQASGIKKYDLHAILSATKYAQDTMANSDDISIKQFLMGIADLSVDDIEKLTAQDAVWQNNTLWRTGA